MVAGVTGSVKGRELAWKFVQKNWAEFVSRYQGGFLLPRVIKCVTENFVTEEKAKEVEVRLEMNPSLENLSLVKPGQLHAILFRLQS